jgi:hypothetical protein
MLKRFLLVLLAAAVTCVGAAQRAPLTADSLGEDPATSPGWEGLPDTDRFSGRFLTLTGNKNESVPGGEADSARNLIRLTFTPALPGDKIRIAVFDGDTRGPDIGGFWDQRVDGTFVTDRPDTHFDLFVDPDNTALGNINALTPDVSLKASTILVDRDWCVLLDDVASNWAAAKGPDGRYHFLLRSTLVAAAGKQLSGFELNGYKIAFNGTYILPAGQILGFVGGAVDTYIQFQGGPGFALTGDPSVDGEVNKYAGDFDFPFNPASFCKDLEFFNADADWNDDTGLADGVIQTPLSNPPLTGVPPDNGRAFNNPQTSEDITNILFKVGAPVQFEVREPDPANTLKFSSLADLAEKRPSRNVAYDLIQTGESFQKVVLAKSLFGPPVAGARWKLRWTGLDIRNSVFIKFDQDFGTTERQPLFTICAFCDDDKDGQFDEGEEGLPGVDVQIQTPQGVKVVDLTTEEDGCITTESVLGSFQAVVTSDLCWTPRFTSPVRFQTDLCEDTKVLLPYDCTGSVDGHVFCDAAPMGEFGVGDTPLGLASTVVLERLDGQLVVETIEVAVGAGVTAFSKSGLMPGSWRASVKSDPAIDLLPKTTVQPQLFTLDSETCKATLTFGYQCAVNVCARFFCDKDGDCLFTPEPEGQDEPLPGVIANAVLKRPGQADVVVPGVTDASGRVCWSLSAGSWDIVVPPGQNVLAGTDLKSAPANPIVVAQENLEFLFCYECVGSICGTVYLNQTNCDGDYDVAVDAPKAGVQVNLYAFPKLPLALPIDTTTTDAFGGYCFLDLDPAQYVVEVASTAGNTAILGTYFATQPTVRTPTVLAGEVVDKQDFGYCELACIYGRVFRDNGTPDCDGVWTEGEDTPIEGVTVRLVGTNPVRPPVLFLTLADGTYKFPNLQPGEYSVSVNGSQPKLVVLAPGSAAIVPVTLLAGDQVEVDYPFCPGKICGTVYKNDPTIGCDGDYDLGADVPLAGVRVELWRSPSLPPALALATTHTLADGSYCFLDLDAGVYQVRVGNLQPTQILVGLSATAPTIRNPVLPAGGTVLNQDFGYCEPGCVRGTVFRDSGEPDCDGIWTPGSDVPISGVTVSIVGTNPVRPPAAMQTLADGSYEFCGLEPGEYAVSVNGQQAKLVVLAPGSALTVPATVVGGDSVVIDFPFCSGKICGTVYRNDPTIGCDEDYDIGFDVPLPGVLVQLWKSPAMPPLSPPVAFTFTLQDGSYCFLDLDAGIYQVRVGSNQPTQILVGLNATQPTVRNPVLPAGGTVLNQDFGYCEPGCIQGTVFRDSGEPDCDGVWTPGSDTPIAGVTVSLVGTNPVRPPQLALTDSNGFYKFPNLQPGQYSVSVNGQQPKLVVLAPGSALVVPATVVAGDTVVVDYPFCSGKICGTVYKNDPTVGCDGDYDIGFDVPLPGVTVLLWKAPTLPPLGLPLASTQTLADGSYCFLDLDAGIYQVRVGTNPPQAILVGLSATAPTIRNPVLPAGGAVLNQDFGYCEPGCVRGTVFRDSGEPDCDGVWTPGSDTPIAGVTVSIVGTNPVRPPAAMQTLADGSYEFCGLQPGSYLVTVSGQQPQLIVLAPGSALNVPATVLGGDVVVIDFPFCAGKICGTVYRNPAEDCDETYDPNQGDLGLGNVEVSLWRAPNGPPGVPLMTTSTLPDGSYCFANLDAGVYRVRVAGQQDGDELLNLVPTQPVQRQPVLLAGGAVLNQDFGYCELLGRIYGYVFQNPTCTCDDVLNAGDTRIPGVTVFLTRFVDDMAILSQDVTDAQGFYEFTGLPAGTYLVEIDGLAPQLVNVSPSTPEQVGPFLLPAGGEERIDFGYCQQRVCGYVFREPPCACDGVFNGNDQPVAGVLVRIDRVDGLVWSAETLTGRDGQYCFDSVPEGVYEITIPPGQPALGGLEPSGDAVRTATVAKGVCRFDLNLGFCPPEEQELCVKVFCEPAGCCDGIFDEGRDLWMEWVEVFAARANAPTVPVATGVTDATGEVCFEELEAGSYVVVVNANQPALQGYRPSTITNVYVQLEPCEKEKVRVGYCKDCKPGPCCEGDLRETLVGTSFWVGDGACDFDLKAKLYADCGGYEIDSVSRKWTKSFGTPLVGVNEVLEVVDVKVACGIAYVVLRIKANAEWFEGGVFGTGAIKFRVTLNGQTNQGCATLRCESFRPGQYFQYSKGLCMPACDCPWRWDGRSAWDAPWICYPDHYTIRYIVLDTYSQQEWECRPLVVASAK